MKHTTKTFYLSGKEFSRLPVLIELLTEQTEHSADGFLERCYLSVSKIHILVVTTLPSTAENRNGNKKDIQKITVSSGFPFQGSQLSLHELACLKCVLCIYFWDMKLEKYLSWGWCLEASHLAMMWLCWTVPQHPHLSDLLSPATLVELYSSLLVCGKFPKATVDATSSKRNVQKWKRLRKWFETLGRRIRWNLRTRQWTSSEYFSLWSQDKVTLETIFESTQVREKSSSDGEKTLEEMERKNETLCWKHCTPQGTPFSPGRFCKLQSIAHNFPNFCHILIPPVLLFIFPHVFSFAEIPTVTSIYIIIPIKRDTQLPKKKNNNKEKPSSPIYFYVATMLDAPHQLPPWVNILLRASGTWRFMKVLGCYPYKYQVHFYFLNKLLEQDLRVKVNWDMYT